MQIIVGFLGLIGLCLGILVWIFTQNWWYVFALLIGFALIWEFFTLFYKAGRRL